MELIDVLFSRRLQRELRRREAALQEAARAPDAARAPEAADPRPLVARNASTTQGWWECEICRRGFHGYGQFLNHNCHKDG